MRRQTFFYHYHTFIISGRIPYDPPHLNIYRIIKISTLSVRPVLGRSLYYSCPGRGSSRFAAYSSCDCSLSALWDACPDPPWHVTFVLTLPIRLAAGSRSAPRLLTPPLPFRSLLLSVPLRLSSRCLGVCQCLTHWVMTPPEEFFLWVHKFVVICHSHHTKFLAGVKSRARQHGFVYQAFDVCVSWKLVSLHYLANTIIT